MTSYNWWLLKTKLWLLENMCFLTAHSMLPLGNSLDVCASPRKEYWAFRETRTRQQWSDSLKAPRKQNLDLFQTPACPEASPHTPSDFTLCNCFLFFFLSIFSLSRKGLGYLPAHTERPACWLGATAHMFLYRGLLKRWISFCLHKVTLSHN